jgi:hypothetical protein
MLQLQQGVPLSQVEYGYTGYTLITGIQYYLFGVDRYAASFLNGFYVVVAGLVLIRIALRLNFTFLKSSVIGLVWLFIPSMLVWTSDSRKESMLFLFAMMVWLLVLNLMHDKTNNVWNIVLKILTVCILLYLCTLLRIYMLYTLTAGILIGMFLLFIRTRRKRLLFMSLAVISICLIATFTTVMTGMKDYHAISVDRSSGGDEDLDEEINSIISIIMHKDIPAAVNGFFTKPYPDQIIEITDIRGNTPAIIFTKIEIILWYLALLLAATGSIYCVLKGNPYLIGILAYIVVYSLINALIAENISETYFRYRAFIYAPILLFADYRPLLSLLKQQGLFKKKRKEIE